MQVSRIAVLIAVGVLLVPAAFLMSRRGADSASDSAPAPAAQPAKPQADKAEAAPDAAKAQSRSGSKPAANESAGMPPKVARALARRQTVVLFFNDGKGADDKATADAVRSLKGRARATAVFNDRLRNLGDYRLVVGNLGVSQSPSVVIVAPGGKARVVEGYVDPESLLQQVLDARR